MKKFVFLFVFLTAFVLSNAQFKDPNYKKNEFTLGYGVITMPNAYEFSTSIFSALTGLSHFVSKYHGHDAINNESSDMGCVDLSYSRYFGEKFALGLSVSFQAISNINTYSFQDSTFKIAWQNNYYSIMLNGKYNYLKYEYFQMYLTLGAGVCIARSQYLEKPGDYETPLYDAKPFFAFQFSPVGIQFGKNIGGFFEFGFGYKGTVRGGLFVKF